MSKKILEQAIRLYNDNMDMDANDYTETANADIQFIYALIEEYGARKAAAIIKEL